MSRVATAPEFKKIKDDLDKAKKRGKMIVVGDLIKDKELAAKEKEQKEPGKKKEVEPGNDGEDDENVSLTREERKKKYLERADVVESINVAADLVLEMRNPVIQLGSKTEEGKSQEAKAN